METFRDAPRGRKPSCAFLPFGLCSPDGDFGAESDHSNARATPLM
jgi:hypothetical protein